MHYNSLLTLVLICGLHGLALAQPFDKITGTWTISRTGNDVETSTTLQMGTNIKWVIRGDADNPQVTVYYVYAAGFVSDANVIVSEADYTDGKLTVVTHPEISNNFINVNTYYAANHATGTYVEIVRSPYNTTWNFLTHTMEHTPDVKKYGSLAMSRSSKSVKPPATKSRPTQGSTPMQVPFLPNPILNHTQVVQRPSRDPDQCRIDSIMCSKSCDSAPTFGSHDLTRFNNCEARCTAQLNNCLR